MSSNNLYAVMKKSEGTLITVRVTDDTHREFKVAADLRGANMSTLIHQFIVKVIREEKEREPEAFIPVKTIKVRIKDVLTNSVARASNVATESLASEI